MYKAIFYNNAIIYKGTFLNSHNMKIKRIKPPYFKCGRYKLNEYEARRMLVDTALGIISPGLVLTDCKGVSASIERDGHLTNSLYGFGVASDLTMALLHAQDDSIFKDETLPASVRVERAKELLKKFSLNLNQSCETDNSQHQMKK